MRIDRNFVREIFLAMQDHEDYVISSHTLMKKLGIKGRVLERKFMGHILILGDKGLIESFYTKYPFGFVNCVGGEYSIVDVDYRMTAQGYEMIDIFKHDEIYSKVKDYTLSNALDLARQLLAEEVVHGREL
ncbi:DUF2513 domain-containing protein [bacterium]|nr:DUF2513 domain-containing protein [bacterium]